LLDLSAHPSFTSADVHTDFIPEHYNTLFPTKVVSDELLCKAAVSLILEEQAAARQAQLQTADPFSPFISHPGFAVNMLLSRRIELKIGETGKCFYLSVINLIFGFCRPFNKFHY